MKIIAIQSSPGDPALTGYNNRISAWANLVTNGWIYIQYNDPSDLISTAKAQCDKHGSKITELEILAHGTKYLCDGITRTNALLFSNDLTKAQILSDNATIILTSCLSGLDSSDYSLPKIIATNTNRIVKGAVGYIRGTYAENSSECVSVLPTTASLPPFPGAMNATGRPCYISFNP